MGIIGTILIGLVVGILAKLLHPGKKDMGIIMTILLGIASSFIATYAGQALGIYAAGQPTGFIGAIILLVLYGLVKRKAST